MARPLKARPSLDVGDGLAASGRDHGEERSVAGTVQAGRQAHALGLRPGQAPPRALERLSYLELTLTTARARFGERRSMWRSRLA